MLSNSCKYAIRAILYLAFSSSESHKIGSKIVAENIGVPAPFLAKIFQLLSKEKIIRSVKGPNGGFYLTELELSKNLLDVVKCIDGLGVFENCFLGLPRCSDENPCTVHNLVAPWKRNLRAELETKTIAEFAGDTKKGDSFIFLK